MSGVEASTIRTLEGSHWRKSSLMNAPLVLLALSPRSCCIWRSSCDGFLSPNSSVLKSCCNLCCSNVAVHLTICSLSVAYGLSLGWFGIKSWISVANVGASEATMWSNLGLLGGNSSSTKLGLLLHKPNLRVSGPVGGKFEVYCCYSVGTRLYFLLRYMLIHG